MTKDILLTRAKDLKLHGIVSHWEEINESIKVKELLDWEETERTNRSLERRLNSARIGHHYKPLANFDWDWPKKCDRELIEELMQLAFLKDATNVIISGPSGVGKTTIVRNIAHQTLLRGHTVLFTTAADMLNELTAQDGDNALRRRIKHYAKPTLLIIDEVGYLSYSNRHADLLFQITAQRYQEKSTMITTNKPFSEWGEMFPNASCVVSLIDRLVHNSEIINIEGPSFRLKEAKEKSDMRKKRNSKKADSEK